ncbi:hypothetical protein [Draconibacterium orientale]|uniref:type II toxin-antitoxin system RelE family toxin n=1 Tax=Draconibacterium orientale TaxID=1168034 RepID=UPI002A0A484E|nr:hypothetical protein [Draconibacterium orientale]
MKIRFLHGFENDLRKVSDKKLAQVILQSITVFESAKSLKEISGVKKLKGHPNAFRYRKGKYRIGFFFEDDTVIFAAFAPRGKIYKNFP